MLRGGAASAEDASTVWFNPAGMAELDDGTHVSAGVHIVKPTAEFSNKGSTRTLKLHPLRHLLQVRMVLAIKPRIFPIFMPLSLLTTR